MFYDANRLAAKSTIFSFLHHKNSIANRGECQKNMDVSAENKHALNLNDELFLEVDATNYMDLQYY